MAELDKKQLNELKQGLQQRFNALREEIRQELLRSDEQHYIDLAGRVHDLGDSSVADLLADLDFAEIDRQVKELQDIEATLQRINMGSYGLCADCDANISYERLKSYPTAKRCITCQKRHEQSYAQAKTPSL